MNDQNGGADLSRGQFQELDRAPVDVGNKLLSEGPMEISFSKLQTQQGQRVAITFRTPSTTFTAFFDRVSGQAVGQRLVEDSGSLTSLVLPANGSVPPGSTFSGK